MLYEAKLTKLASHQTKVGVVGFTGANMQVKVIHKLNIGVCVCYEVILIPMFQELTL